MTRHSNAQVQLSGTTEERRKDNQNYLLYLTFLSIHAESALLLNICPSSCPDCGCATSFFSYPRHSHLRRPSPTPAAAVHHCNLQPRTHLRRSAPWEGPCRRNRPRTPRRGTPLPCRCTSGEGRRGTPHHGHRTQGVAPSLPP